MPTLLRTHTRLGSGHHPNLTVTDLAPEATGEAMRYKVMDARNPVYVDPCRSFGIPTVSGVRTEIIAELSLAGEPHSAIIDIYRDHGVTEEDVKTAVTFETRFLQAA